VSKLVNTNDDEADFQSLLKIWQYRLFYRALLQKRPIKESIFCKRDLYLVLWGGYDE